MSTASRIRRGRGLLLLGVMLVPLGCTRTDGGSREAAPPSVDTELSLGDATADVATEDAADLLARLEGAALDRDMCALASVFEAGLPSFDDRDAVVAVYRRLAEVVEDAAEWVPDELSDDWKPISATLVDGAASVEAAEGDLSAPGVAATFGGDDLQRSVITVARWSERNC